MRTYLVHAEYDVDYIIELFQRLPVEIHYVECGIEKVRIIEELSIRMQQMLRSQICVACGMIGNLFRFEENCGSVTAPHFNLYHRSKASRKRVHWYDQMTRDHIIPKYILKRYNISDSLNNAQTMCEKCNSDKNNRIQSRYLTPELVREMIKYNTNIFKGVAISHIMKGELL